MTAPRHIVDALECVLTIYFSNARHKERAAFILCDELIEVTCREKIKLTVHNLGNMRFKALLTHPEVGLDVDVPGLGRSVFQCHLTRNDMQHNNPAATVDAEHCADAIMDGIVAIEHCFPGTRAALPDRLKVTLRVLRLFSQQGDQRHRTTFSNAMHAHVWRVRERARREETIIAPGQRANWGLVIPSEFAQVETLLDAVGVPPY